MFEKDYLSKRLVERRYDVGDQDDRQAGQPEEVELLAQ
jgi:hypothetical protein